jgi:hypothetical protein
MRYKSIFITALLGLFTAIEGLAYDGTGMWTYEEQDPSNTCGFIYTAESGEVGILQDGSGFLIVGDDFSTYGTVNGNTYTYSDVFCLGEDDPDYIVQSVTLVLSSATAGTGTVNWNYYTGTYPTGNFVCSGSHQLIISKQTQAAPFYDATGKWNFTQTGGKRSGYFTVSQTGNKITAVDDLGAQYSGFVNGTEYTVVRSYLESGGRTTDWYLITLTSETEGGGNGTYVWDDDCDDSSGTWSITVAKEVYTITATATAGGTISPSGAITLDSGASQEFQINADFGFVIADVLVDGSSIGAVSSHPFNGVAQDHTIHAVFQLDAEACESIETQDFEGGVVPPNGWKLQTTNQSYTWQIHSLLPHAGSYGAEVLRDPAFSLQDEILLSQKFHVTEAILHFWSFGSLDWCRDTFDNCDLEIWIVVGEWDAGAGDDIYVGKADDDWVETWVWADSSFNLTPLLPGGPVRIAFRYIGTEGAQIAIDDVRICSDKSGIKNPPFLLLLLE